MELDSSPLLVFILTRPVHLINPLTAMEPTSSKLRALIPFVAVVLGVVIYMGSRKDNESGDNTTDLVPNLSGHSQMLALLKSIADNSDNRYFGDGAIVRMRSQLAVTRPGTLQEAMLRLLMQSMH